MTSILLHYYQQNQPELAYVVSGVKYRDSMIESMIQRIWKLLLTHKPAQRRKVRSAGVGALLGITSLYLKILATSKIFGHIGELNLKQT